jgi:hypothetical protein
LDRVPQTQRKLLGTYLYCGKDKEQSRFRFLHTDGHSGKRHEVKIFLGLPFTMMFPVDVDSNAIPFRGAKMLSHPGRFNTIFSLDAVFLRVRRS